LRKDAAERVRDFGRWMRDQKGRFVGDLRFVNKPDDKHGAKWWVERKDGESRPGKRDEM
jgi:hypothetical protein